MFDLLISFAYGAGFFAALFTAYVLFVVVMLYTDGWRSQVWRSWPAPVRKVLTITGWVLLVLFLVLLAAAQGADIRGAI